MSEKQMSNIENLEAGQELTISQTVQWIEKYGDTTSLEYFTGNEWVKSYGVQNTPLKYRYRVAPEKVNDPDDPTTWEYGVAIFARDSEYDAWSLDFFSCYLKNVDFKYVTNLSEWRYAKLATPEQVEAWKLIND